MRELPADQGAMQVAGIALPEKINIGTETIYRSQILTDTQYQRWGVETVERVDEGWFCTHNDGWILFVKDVGIEPKPGDILRMYGQGIGYTVRGIVIEEKGIVRYRTEAQEQLDREVDRERKQNKRQDELDDERSERNLRIRELPQSLRQRIERFQIARENWRRDYEDYELFVCEEAAKIAQHFEGKNGIYHLNEWTNQPNEQQESTFPVSDQHSGHTLEKAISLARLLLLDDEEAVIRDHGGECSFVGCEEYGCFAAEAKG